MQLSPLADSLLLRTSARRCLLAPVGARRRRAGAARGPRSRDIEVVAECLTDHRRRGLLIAAGALSERVAQFGFETDGFDARRRGAHRRPSAAPADDLVDVEPCLCLPAELADELIGDRLSARRLAVVLLRHRQSPG